MPNQHSYQAPVDTVTLTGANQIIFTGDCIFYGLSIMDDAAGQIKVRIYDGTDDSGKAIHQLNVNSGGNDHDWFGPNGIKMNTGIFIKVIAGTPTGVAFYR